MSWQQYPSGLILPEDFFDDIDKTKDRVSRLERSVRNLYEGGGGVTSLPTTPYEGQRIRLVADAANGIEYDCVYDSSVTGASKWVVLGGSPMVAESNVNHGLFTTSAYASTGNAATLPALTLPFAGDWDVKVAGQSVAAQNAGVYARLSYKIGAGTASDDDAALTRASVTGQNAFQSVSLERPKTGLAAGTVLQMQFRTSDGTAGWPNGNGAGPPVSLWAMPVRLG